MELKGTWQALPANEELRRCFHKNDYDDSSWISLQIPGHWAEHPELAHMESVLYRYKFSGPHTSAAEDTRATTTEPVQDTIPGAGRSSAAEDTRATTTEPTGSNLSASESSANTECVRNADPITIPIQDRRWWICFEGIAQQGDIWFDGAYLGQTDGYFVSHEMEITEHIKKKSDHVLAVEATCQRFGDPDNRFTLTGALQDPELIGHHDLIIGGIWRPVTIRSSGTIAIRHARAICADVQLKRGSSSMKAQLALRVVLDAPNAATVNLCTRVAGVKHVHVHHAAAGDNRVEWSVDVENPQLWWPYPLGEQVLYDLTIEVMTGTEVHDYRRCRIGFRKISMRNFVFSINGQRMHLKGVNLLPTRALLGTAQPEDIVNDITLAKTASLNMVRPLAHISRPELYEAADKMGVLIWQDLPIRGIMNRALGREAYRQAREAVDLLGHHPSVAVWCAHDEPFMRSKYQASLPPTISREGPSWNRDILDRKLCRILNRCDGSRPVLEHTAVSPRWYNPKNTSSSILLGHNEHNSKTSDEQTTNLASALARLPRKGKFISALTTSKTTTAADTIRTADTIRNTIEILRRLKYRPNGGFLFSYLADVDAASHPASQPNHRADGSNAYDPHPTSTQEVTSNFTDSNSRHQHGSPTKTAIHNLGFGLLDSQRRPKSAVWEAFQEACKPLLVVADPLPQLVYPDSPVSLNVHIVNDYRKKIDEIAVRSRVLVSNKPPGDFFRGQHSSTAETSESISTSRQPHRSPDCSIDSEANGFPCTVIAERGWKGTVKSDTCVRIGRIKFRLPAYLNAPPFHAGPAHYLTVELEVRVAGKTVSHSRRVKKIRISQLGLQLV